MSSVLEQFYFAFAADASKLKEGLKGAHKDSDDLEKKLQSTDDVAEKLGASFAGVAKAAGAALAAIFALHEVKKITEETADHTYEVYRQAKAMGIAVESLSAWQHAVIASGGTADSATQSMSGLRDKFVEMARFGGMMGPEALAFQQLGLSVKDMHDSIKDPMVAMTRLAETFGKLNNQQQLFLGKKLGLDLGTISLLAQGRRGMEEMIAKQKELGVVTEQQALASAKFKLQQAELGMVYENVSREITSVLLPAFTWLMEGTERMIGFLREHKTFTIAFFGGVAAVITALYLPAMISAAAATIAVIGPWLLLGAAIAAGIALFAIIIEDIWAFAHGQSSLIGDMLKQWPMIGAVFKSIGEVISMTWDLIKGVFQAMVGIITGAVSDAFGYLREKATEAIEWLIKKFPGLVEAAKVLQIAMISVGHMIAEPFKYLYDLLAKIFDLVAHAPVAAFNWLGKQLSRITGGKFDEIGGPSTAAAAATGASKAIVGGIPAEVQAAADAAEKKYGIPAAVTVAQWKLESASGTKMPAGSNNPFGIKAKAGQPYVEAETSEFINGQMFKVKQRFAKFDSLGDAFEAHAKLLATGAAYSDARQHMNDPKAYADALTGHYATDPNYGAKLKKIMGDISSSPINSMSSQAIAAGSINTRGATNISVGDVAVHTQATDGQDVSRAIADHFVNHLRNATDQFDDGTAG